MSNYYLYPPDEWGRRPHKCGKCGNIVFSSWKCPKREKSRNEYVCCRCCYRCGFIIDTDERGLQCSIKINRRKAEKKQRQSAKPQKKKASATDTDVGSSLFDR